MNQTDDEEEYQPRAPIPEKGKGCWYPMWEGDVPTHIYCDEPKKEGSDYCSHHHSIVYVEGSAGRIKLPSWVK